MSEFITFKLSGLRELDQALNDLDLKVRKRAMRPAMKKAMSPVYDRVKQNLVPISDTGGLAGTVRRQTLFSKTARRGSGRKAAVIGRVVAGTSRQRPGKTGSQALQVEFGTRKAKAQPFMRPAVVGHERKIIGTFAKELGASIERIARRTRRR